MTLVFCTHNQHKFDEVKVLMPKPIKLLSLKDIGCFEDIPETGTTLEENASIKTNFVLKRFNYNCFSDDTGLLVKALNGAPGVYSARYAGPKKDSLANMDLLLKNLENNTNRKAHFKTVISLCLDGQQHFFKGIAQGHINKQKMGEQGFGYDPIFTPVGYNQTFAQLPLKVKNKISHRGKAIAQLIEFLNKRV